MKTKAAAAAILILAALGSSESNAEAFIGVGVNSNSYAYSDLDNSSGNKLFLGYYAQSGVFGEVARIDLGDTQADFSSLGLEVDGFAAYLGYRNQGNTGFGIFGKVGLYSFDSDLLSSGSSVATESSNGLAWSLGASYAFDKTVAIRGELEQFVAVEDFADDESVTGGSVSLELRF